MIAVFFIAAYIAYELASSKDSDPPWYFAVGSLTTSIGTFCVYGILHYNKQTVDKKNILNCVFSLIYLLSAIVMSHILEVFLTFAAAFIITPLFLIWIYLSHTIVKYDIAKLNFSLNRSTSYALMRGIIQAIVVRTKISNKIAHIFPFIISSIETIGMLVYGIDKSYSFKWDSIECGIYITLKASLFLTLPLIEDSLIPNCVV